MKDQHIAEIRKACIEANPAIKKLEMGCIIGIFQREMRFISLYSYADGQHVLNYMSPNGQTHNGTYATQEIEDLKIIGRPIRLVDIAHLLKENWAASFETTDKLSSRINRLIVVWNLLKDDLTDQDEPTLAFISSLLKK